VTNPNTAPNPPTSPTSKQRKLKRINPELVKFESEGDLVEGTLVGSRVMEFSDGDAMRYTLKEDDGSLIVFFGSTIIDGLMESVDVGTYVRVTFIGEDKTTAGRPVKLYDIEVEV
tara:strand:+ start:317 stop:661 length:345 start_codon:yes stop_codon:yes gene_type:complete